MMRDRVGVAAVFRATFEGPVRCGEVQRRVMDLVPLMQALQGFQRPNLSAPRGRMQKIGVDP